ncbi:hypothetical protein BC940DRAFT_306063 [Gongronella butleri]|nr:hypothetical protein BC940DRAFT_306063 [Gongronella butleri]
MISSYMDAIGYDTHDKERLVLKSSGSCAADDLAHAADDTVKIVQKLMTILKRDADDFQRSSLATFKKIKAFGIQTIQDTMILSEMHMGDNLQYIYKEVMSVKVPLDDSGRVNWVPVAEMLAYLMIELHAQNDWIRTAYEEHGSLVEVDPNDMIRNILKF